MTTGDPTHKPTDTPTESEPGPGDPLAELLSALASKDPATRLEAIQKLTQPETANRAALYALERAAAQDRRKEIREAALEALTSPAYRTLQRRGNRYAGSRLLMILQEIERWEADELITPHTARLLAQRYRFVDPGAEKPAEKRPAKTPAREEPRRALSEVLLSETTIRTALYLGAFFVISAACILATAVEVFRLPILLLGTFGFFGAAVALKRRLPQASFIFSIIFSFMIPLDAGVLQDSINLSADLELPYWIVVMVALTLLWAVGTFFYRSRFFSALVLLAGSGVMLLLGRWIDQSAHLDLFLVAVPTLAALGGVFALRRWQDEVFARPLFWVAQLQQLGLLGVSVAFLVFALVNDDPPAAGWWLLISATWFMGVAFYFISHRHFSFFLFPWLTVATLVPAPLFFFGVLSPTMRVMTAIAWVWSAVLTIAGEGLNKVERFGLRVYSLYLLVASALLFTLAAIGGLADRISIGIGYLAGITLVYLGLALYRPRGPVWFGALLAGTAAYFASFALPILERFNFYPGFVMLWPALLWLAAHLLARRIFKLQPAWHLPPLILGILIALPNGLFLLVSGGEEPLRAALAFGIWGAFLAAYSILDKKPVIGYGATVGLALSLLFILLQFEQTAWVIPFVGLASIYYFGGLVAAYLQELGGWGMVLRASGLALGLLVSLSAPFQGGPAAIIGTTFVATTFAIEAFRSRNVWLGFPANLLYLGAYFMILLELDVSQPQFYSIGAALLGFIMHYLLVRSGSRTGAFITGLISQLILLGTTYIQMVSTESLLFFVVLFLQALVVLVYGLVVRTKSFVIMPIIFFVLGIISVTFSALAGIPTIILIGCTGLLLLALGVLALLMREQLLAVTDRLGKRLGGWRA